MEVGCRGKGRRGGRTTRRVILRTHRPNERLHARCRPAAVGLPSVCLLLAAGLPRPPFSLGVGVCLSQPSCRARAHALACLQHSRRLRPPGGLASEAADGFPVTGSPAAGALHFTFPLLTTLCISPTQRRRARVSFKKCTNYEWGACRLG